MSLIAAGVAVAAGVGLGVAGTNAKAREAKQQRADLLNAAQLPGLNTSALTKEALAGENASLPGAEQLASQIGTFEQGRLNAQEDQALPGVGTARQSALANIQALLGDDASWLQGVQRRGAALGLSRGVGGSAFGNIGTLRLSDQESQARKAQGTGLLNSLLGSLRIANTPSVQTFMAPTPAQLINIRGAERASQQNLMAGLSKMATPGGVWGGFMNQLGGSLFGAGTALAGGGMGGGGFGGSGGASGFSQPPAGTVVGNNAYYSPSYGSVWNY